EGLLLGHAAARGWRRHRPDGLPARSRRRRFGRGRGAAAGRGGVSRLRRRGHRGAGRRGLRPAGAAPAVDPARARERPRTRPDAQTGLYAAEWPGRWIHAAALAARAPGVAGPAHGGFCIAPRQLLDSSRLPGIGMAAGNGSLSCVGLGMMLGAHIGPRARATIEQADVVFGAVSDPLVELWLQQMNADVRSLQPYYAEGK